MEVARQNQQFPPGPAACASKSGTPSGAAHTSSTPMALLNIHQ